MSKVVALFKKEMLRYFKGKIMIQASNHGANFTQTFSDSLSGMYVLDRRYLKKKTARYLSTVCCSAHQTTTK